MKGSKVFGKLKSYKAVGILAGILLAVVLLGGLACAFAGLLMLLWNVVMVAALSIAVPLTFLTALKGVAIFYGVLSFAHIIRSKVQMQVAMKMMRQFESEMQDAQAGKGDDDILRHFRMS